MRSAILCAPCCAARRSVSREARAGKEKKDEAMDDGPVEAGRAVRRGLSWGAAPAGAFCPAARPARRARGGTGARVSGAGAAGVGALARAPQPAYGRAVLPGRAAHPAPRAHGDRAGGRAGGGAQPAERPPARQPVCPPARPEGELPSGQAARVCGRGPRSRRGRAGGAGAAVLPRAARRGARRAGRGHGLALCEPRRTGRPAAAPLPPLGGAALLGGREPHGAGGGAARVGARGGTRRPPRARRVCGALHGRGGYTASGARGRALVREKPFFSPYVRADTGARQLESVLGQGCRCWQ